MFALLAAHALAACIVIALSLPPLLKVALLLCVGASMAYRRRPQADCDYVFDADGRVECLASVSNSSVGADDTPSNLSRQNLAQILEVDAASQLLGRLMVVRFRNASVGASLVLLPDSFICPDDYRRVRLWLKWQGKGNPYDSKHSLDGGAQDSI